MNREAIVLGKKAVSMRSRAGGEELITLEKWLIENRFMLEESNPTKEFIDDVIEGKIEIRKYERSNRAFDFFLNLMRNVEID